MPSYSEKFQKPLEEYISFFETLSPRSIPLIEKVVHPLVHFTDPFNDVRGSADMQAVFKKAFEDVENLKFKVFDHSWGQDEATAYLKWRCDFSRSGKADYIIGMSEVRFTEEGLVESHYDFWDSGLYVYEKVPVLRTLIRFIKNKLSVRPS